VSKEKNIVHENGAFWVLREKGAYYVMKTGATHSESESAYHPNDDGLSIAVATGVCELQTEKEIIIATEGCPMRVARACNQFRKRRKILFIDQKLSRIGQTFRRGRYNRYWRANGPRPRQDKEYQCF